MGQGRWVELLRDPAADTGRSALAL